MDCTKLKDEYAAAVSTRMLARKGFRVTRTTGPKGEIVLKATALIDGDDSDGDDS